MSEYAMYAILTTDRKKNKSAISAAYNHNERIKEYDTPNIDKSRTNDNYHLIDCRGNYREFFEEQIKNITNRITSRSILMIEHVITASAEFFARLSYTDIRKYFMICLDFVKTLVDRSHIVSAVVHMDEKTPHMHVSYVPITKDGKLCFSRILPEGPGSYSKLQDEFYLYIKPFFPEFIRGVPKKYTHSKHVHPYLRQEATELDGVVKTNIDLLSKMDGRNWAEYRDILLEYNLPFQEKSQSFLGQLHANDAYICDLECKNEKLQKKCNTLESEREKYGERYDNIQSIEDENKKLKEENAIYKTDAARDYPAMIETIRSLRNDVEDAEKTIKILKTGWDKIPTDIRNYYARDYNMWVHPEQRKNLLYLNKNNISRDNYVYDDFER